MYPPTGLDFVEKEMNILLKYKNDIYFFSIFFILVNIIYFWDVISSSNMDISYIYQEIINLYFPKKTIFILVTPIIPYILSMALKFILFKNKKYELKTTIIIILFYIFVYYFDLFLFFIFYASKL